MDYNTHYRNEATYEQEDATKATMAPLDLVPYQIDYSSKNVGKTVANTKKKIEFKFGFANNDALSHGQKGVECRGLEHKIILKWSLTSGKTVVECDSKEIHYGLSGNKVRLGEMRRGVIGAVIRWRREGCEEIFFVFPFRFDSIGVRFDGATCR